MSTKGKWLTIEQKCELIAQHRREPAVNYTQLALWAKDHFELSVPPTRQTIRNILNAAADIEAKRQPVQGQDAEAERARVENLRQKAKKRLREIEKEAREIRKYLRRLDDATNAQQVLMQ
ncbi:Calcium-transporting ATPase PAT1 [Phytophthora nicotianae]|uniref:Calcium-transporting ATPase PAT1 n=1 Tax=Phytophthora nicotianae TaxID=4792 RepID=A0A0W8DAR7_PHYNI|nr:Calcium-transporting ATPase PAT1 [Phytophthora nicotianae]